MNDFWSELKRRNVFRVGVAYGFVAWLLMQVSSLFAAAFVFPQVIMHVVIFMLMLGFPLAIFFAWAFELTPDGLKRSAEVGSDASVTKATGQKLNRIIIGVLAMVTAVLLADRFVLPGGGDENVQVAEVSLPLGERSYESIAVLPFVNMSDDKSQEYFSDGISEELLNLLAQTKGLRVAARTSSFAFKGKNQDIKKIGQQLDVETVLEGSVRKANTQLRITAQLIDVETGFHLWSDTYDRELVDVFKIQDEISAAIVGALSVHFGGEVAVAAKSTEVNVEAYQHYLMGRDLLGQRTKEKLERAVEHFTKAIEADPSYAAAYSGKADAYMLLSNSPGSYGDIPLSFAHELAVPLVMKAMSLDPGLADGHSSQGFLLYQQGDFEGALGHFDRALELRPSFAMALMWKALTLRGLQRSKEAGEALRMAHSVDPLSLVISSNLVGQSAAGGDLEFARKLAQQMKEVAPERFDRWGSAQRVIAYFEGDLSGLYELSLLGEEKFPEAEVGNVGIDLIGLGEVERGMALLGPLEKVQAYQALGTCPQTQTLYASIPVKEQQSLAYHGTGFFFSYLCLKDYDLALEKLAAVKKSLGGRSDFLFGGQPSGVAASYVLLLYQEMGDEENAALLRGRLATFIEKNKADGYGDLTALTEARLKIIDGDLDAAVSLLNTAQEIYGFAWADRNDTILSRLEGREDYQVIVERAKAHLNKERAELGWEPIE